MREQPTGKAAVQRVARDWKFLPSLSDKGIRSAVNADPESRRTDVDSWRQANVAKPHAKQMVTIRLDEDLPGWPQRQEGASRHGPLNLKGRSRKLMNLPVAILMIAILGLPIAFAQTSSEATLQGLLAVVKQLRLALEKSAVVAPVSK